MIDLTMILSTLILYSTMIDLTMILYVDDAFFIFTWSGDTTNRVVWELRSDQQIQQPPHKHSNQPTIALAVWIDGAVWARKFWFDARKTRWHRQPKTERPSHHHPSPIAVCHVVRELLMIHVGGTRCVTSSTDQIMTIQAWITWTFECIRPCTLIFFFDG